MPLLQRRRVLAAKIESSVGTAIAIGAADGVFNVFNTVIQPDIPFEEREGQAGFSPLPGVLGTRSGTVEFDIDIFGGATAAWATTFLPACGLYNTAGVYALDSKPPEASGSNTKTLTIGVHEDGVLKKLHGCMGNVKFTIKSGFVARAHFMFKGLWNAPTDVALVAPTYPTTSPLRSASMTMTVGSYSPKYQEMTIDLGNDVQLREDPTTLQGLHSAVIVGRRIVGTMDQEAQLVATYDPHGDWIAGTQRALSAIIGSSGNRITFAAPKLQITKCSEQSRNNIATDPIEFQLNRSASAGEDELVVTLD